MEYEKVFVKVYGESFKIHRVNLKKDVYSLDAFYEIAKQLDEPLEQALLNITFFKLFNEKYGNDKFYCIHDFVDDSFGGLVNNSKAKIELRKGRKILQKFSLNDLFKPKTLVPLFTIQKRKKSVKLRNNLFLIEKEIGLVGTYEIRAENFDIYKLKFKISDVDYNNNNHQLLLALSYNQLKLNATNSDTLITYQHCVIHNI